MSAHILVVDDLLPNVRLLQGQLTNEYLRVTTATEGEQALQAIRRDRPDLVLLDVIMPGLTGFEVCAAMRSDPGTADIPVILITALSDISDRVQGFKVGADDFFTKPVAHDLLLARIRNLIREKMLIDELRLHYQVVQRLASQNEPKSASTEHGRLLLAGCDSGTGDMLRCGAFIPQDFTASGKYDEAHHQILAGRCDLAVVNLETRDFDALQLCAEIRANPEGRRIPLIGLAPRREHAKVIRAFNIGINACLFQPVDGSELAEHVRIQLAKKRELDRIRRGLDDTLSLAFTDRLTGLPNRHCLAGYLSKLTEQPNETFEQLSALVIDIDHFKRINDVWGHSTGDEVLVEVGRRIKAAVREADFACRYGGEEFLVIFKRLEAKQVLAIAERLRASIELLPCHADEQGRWITVTVSIGIAHLSGERDSIEGLFRRADEALYAAKHHGRNQVHVYAA